MTHPSPAPTGGSDPLFDALEATVTSAGIRAMFALLAERLAAQQRWHALFDARLLEARATLGLPLAGELVMEPEATPATPASPAIIVVERPSPTSLAVAAQLAQQTAIHPGGRRARRRVWGFGELAPGCAGRRVGPGVAATARATQPHAPLSPPSHPPSPSSQA